VEVIPGPLTAAATGEFLRDLAARMGKVPLVVRRDVPGFIWNRIQFAVLRECLHMLEQGVASAEDIDAAMSDGLAPRWTAAGPLATADLGGLATFARICEGIFPHLAAETDAPAAIVAAAESGRPLQDWTRREGFDIEGLRADALAAGRRIAEERRRRIS
jgi:3-hydroxyacyl-CoA dehydrogenase